MQHLRGEFVHRRKLRSLIRLFYALCAVCCAGLPSPAQPQSQEPPRCEVYAAPTIAGHLDSAALYESSGLAWSAQQPGVLWTHNDSGDGPLLMAFAADGKHLGTWQVSGAAALDWEDIAVGPCRDGQRRCLYIADSGNNMHDRQDLALYRVPEPVVDLTASLPIEGQITGVERLPFRYPDGDFDCESLMVHPSTGALFWVTKSLSGDSFFYYWPSFDAPTVGGLAIPERLGLYNFGRVPILQSATTGADFAPDGGRFVVRTYQRAHEFSLVGEGEISVQVQTAIQSPALVWTIPSEDQGEAIAYAPDGKSIWTTTEGERPPLSRFECARWLTPPPPDADDVAEGPSVEDTSDVPTSDPDTQQPTATNPPETSANGSGNGNGACGCGQTRRQQHTNPVGWGLGLAVFFGVICARLGRRRG